MKKFFKYVLTLCLIVPCIFALVACGGGTLTKADYIEAVQGVKTAYNSYLLGDTAAAGVSGISDSDFEPANNNVQAKNMTKASLAMLYFMRNICLNDGYEIKNGFEDCMVDDGDYVYDIRLEVLYNNNIITVKVAANYRDKNVLNYFVFDIDYSFSAKILNGFSIIGYSGASDNRNTSGVRYYKFADNNLRVLPTSAQNYELFATGVLDELDDFLSAEKSANPADYSTEYLDAMMEVMS